MTTHLTSLPCDVDHDPVPGSPVERTQGLPPVAPVDREPSWLNTYLSAFARIDANTTVRAESTTDPVNGATVLRVTAISVQGGMVTLEMSHAGMTALGKAIADAKAKAGV
jgi:hypothetical protein